MRRDLAGACWRSVGTVGILKPVHTRAAPTHTASHVLPTCALQCGQLLARHFDALLERPVADHLPFDLVNGMDDRGVIAAAERLTDLHQLHPQHVAREAPRHPTRARAWLGAGLGAPPFRRHAPAAPYDCLHAV